MGLSAKRLGEKIGLTAEQTNTLLKDEGYIIGDAGEYILTEKGKMFARVNGWDNGYGGFAYRGYNYNEYDESILNNLNINDENLERIRNLTLANRKERKIKKELFYKNCEKEQLLEEAKKIKSQKNNNICALVIGVTLVIVTIGGVVIYRKYKKNKEKGKKKVV